MVPSTTKTALIADDDSSVRGMIGRLLRPLGWNTVEVPDGCTAVETLTTQQIDLAILDQRMSQLTGTEVLNVIRNSAAHADLPVVIVTGAPEAESSEAILALGISDYLVKPLRPEFARERLARVDAMIRASAPKRRFRGQERPRDGSVLMVVDADAENRSFISTVLMNRYQVIEVPSAVAALRSCIVARPSIFLIGSDVGLMAPQFLARKLRERRDLAGTKIVMVSAKASAQASMVFDGFIARTFVPSEFLAQFDAVFALSFDDDGEVLGGVRKTVESATAQAVGMLAGTGITMKRGNAQSLKEGHMLASVDMQLETERVSVRLLLRSAPDQARALGSKMMSTPVADLTEEDGLATLGELANIIAGRVKTSIVSGGGKATFSLPETQAHPPVEAALSSDAILEFSPEDNAFQLVVILQILPRRRQVAPPTTHADTPAEAALQA